MTALRRVRNVILGSTVMAGLVFAMSACTGPGPALRAAGAPTSTPEQVKTIAPQPAAGAPNTAPAAGGLTGGNAAAVGAPAIAIGQAAPALAAKEAAGSSGTFAPQAAPVAATDLSHGIMVSGSGRVSLRPDQAVVTAGVQTRGRTAQEAQSENNKAMNAVIAAIKGLGIPDKDVQTNGVSLYPIFDQQGQTISGYTASNNVSVIVEKIDQAGPVLDAAVKAGANQATNVVFGLKDETAARNKALTLAAADAKSKAEALAGSLGLHISGVQSVSEGVTSRPIVQPAAGRAMAATDSAASVPVEPGEVDVTAQVTIVFNF
jgi:hypothetical protein